MARRGHAPAWLRGVRLRAGRGQAAALGAAIQAAWCLTPGADRQAQLAALCERCVQLDASTQTQPDPARTAQYEEVYQHYREQVSRLAEHNPA